MPIIWSDIDLREQWAEDQLERERTTHAGRMVLSCMSARRGKQVWVLRTATNEVCNLTGNYIVKSTIGDHLFEVESLDKVVRNCTSQELRVISPLEALASQAEGIEE